MRRLLIATALLGLCLLGAPAVTVAAPSASPTAPPNEVNPDDSDMPNAVTAPASVGSTNPEAQKAYQAGIMNLNQGNAEEAISALSQAAKIDAGSAEIWYQLSVAEAKAGRYDDAHTAADRAIKLNPKSAEYHYSLAIIHLKQKDPNKAIVELSAVTRLAPKEAGPWFTLASIYDQKSDRRRAIGAYRHYLELSPDGAMAGEAAHRARQLQVQDDIEENRRRNPNGL